MIKKITILIVALVSLFSLVPLAMPASTNFDVQGTVTIAETCGFDVSPKGTNALSFGQLLPGASNQPSAPDNITVTNTGSIPVGIYVNGTDWTAGSLSMPVGKTEYGLTAPPSTPLTLLPPASPVTTVGNLPSPNTASIYFDLSIPSGQAAGAYTQDITVTGC